MSVETECGWKHQYDTKKEAKRAAERFNAFRGGKPALAYKCSFCGLFHIGHKPFKHG